MAKMQGLTPQAITQKQINAVNAAVGAYKTGVQAVKTAPGQLAAQAKDRYISGVQQNVDKWASNVAAVTLSQWIQKAVNVGATRLGPGITAAADKITAFWGSFLPILQGAQQQIKSMPKDTFEQRLARMTEMATILHNAGSGTR